MRDYALNKEAKLHRLLNQRRIAYSLIERARTLLKPGIPFTRELHELFRSQGKFGSRDRRLYRELVYTYLRYQPWLEPFLKEERSFMERLIKLAAPTQEIVSLYPTLPDKEAEFIAEGERYRALGHTVHDLEQLLPTWFGKHLSRNVSEKFLQTQFSRPPLWLRVQSGSPSDCLAQLRSAIGPEKASLITAHPLVPDCIQAPADFSVTELPCYKNGQIEIQDISSQLLLLLPQTLPSGKWLDACAGAGGKSLQLAKLLGKESAVHAYDPRRSALRELNARLSRSPFKNITVLDSRPNTGAYQGVLVDAPCSGSGTWRRHPFLIRQTREEDIHRHAEQQLSILKTFAPLVAVGGTLLYSTCSLSKFENEAVAAKFLSQHPEFSQQALTPRFGYLDRGHGITIYPEDQNGDGLYIAAFRRSS